MTQNPLTLVQGTVDLLVLRALAAGPSHGYAVSRWVRERTDGVLGIEDASLYQTLHRLEAKSWIEAEWGLSDNNRRAKYYSLTVQGRRQLRTGAATWRLYAAAMAKVLEAS